MGLFGYLMFFFIFYFFHLVHYLNVGHNVFCLAVYPGGPGSSPDSLTQ